MEVRIAGPGDIAGIVELLRTSLGDNLLPKTERSWRWKHLENVFGPSFVLLAMAQGEIVGVRPFMRWTWIQGGRQYHAVRAVDTATRPDFQGKGIFSKLTKQLVEDCRQAGVDFVFNTPNEKSMPGYLKLGWQSLGRLPISMRPLIPGRMTPDFQTRYQLPQKFSNPLIANPANYLTTSLSHSYLHWRYKDNPLAHYNYLSSGVCEIIFRLKKNRYGREFRICEVLGNATDSSIPGLLYSAAADAGALFISFARQQLPLWAAHGRWGPNVTVRGLANENLVNFRSWKPSLGDLELF